MTFDPLPIAFWSGLTAAAFLLGWHAGSRRAYRHGFEDGVELAADFEVSPPASGVS